MYYFKRFAPGLMARLQRIGADRMRRRVDAVAPRVS